MKKLCLFLLCAALAHATVTVQVNGVTPTEAVLNISLTAANGSACTVEISESPTWLPLVHDVDPSLFSGSNLTSRTGTLNPSAAQMIFHAGKRASETASNGQRISRALAAGTLHFYRVNQSNSCDSGAAATGSFTTAAIPSGRLYNDPMPAEWPHFYGNSRSTIVDPQTGAKIIELNRPNENYGTIATSGLATWPYFGGIPAAAFGTPYDPTGTWSVSGSTWTLTTNTRTPLVMPMTSLPWSAGGTYETLGATFLDYLKAHIYGNEASDSIDVCLSIAGGGNRCDSPVITHALPTSGGTTDTTFGDTNGMPDWGATFYGLDSVLASPHSGTVTVAGSVLTWASAFWDGKEHSNSFRPQSNGWMAGTQVLLGGDCAGTSYYLTGAPTGDGPDPTGGSTNATMTVTPTPTACNGATVSYAINPFVLLIKRHTAVTTTLTINPAGGTASNFDYAMDNGETLGSSAMQDGAIAVSPAPITTMSPTGYLVGTNTGYYVVQSTPAVTFIGRIVVGYQRPSGDGNIDGHSTLDCPPVAFSPSDPKTMYCILKQFGNGTLLYKIVYNGNWTTPANPVLPECLSGANPPPCIDITRIGTGTLESQFETAYPTLAHTCCFTSFYALGPFGFGQLGDGNLQFQATYGSQDTLGVFGVYNPVTAQWIAARDSWSSWPFTMIGVHSAQLWRGTHIALPGGIPGNGWPGPGTTGPAPTVPASLAYWGGNIDNSAGHGPYWTHTTSGMTSVPCPAQPGGSIVQAAYWPGGTLNPSTSDCYQVSVEGGICDPSPRSFSTTVTTNGTTTLNFAADDWGTSNAALGWVNKTITIGGNTYTMQSFQNSDQMTATAPTTNDGNTTGVIQAEPLDSGAGGAGHCGANTEFFLRNWASGDIFYVGAPTSGITANGSSWGYETYPATQGGATYEGFMVLSRTGSTLVVQGNYDGTSGHQAWASGATLYADSGRDIGMVDHNQVWNYVADPTGTLGAATIQESFGEGHGYSTDYTTFGFVSNTTQCPNLSTEWGGNVAHNCIGGIYSPTPLAYMAPGYQKNILAFAPSYAGQTGSSLNNSADDHPFAPFFTPGLPLAISGHVWNGHDDQPRTGTDTGSGILQFPAAQRAQSSASMTSTKLLSLEKALPLQVNCGQVAGTNMSTPVHGNTITTSSPVGAFASVVSAGEGISTSQPGDLIIYCPGSEKASFDAGISSGGDHIDVGAYFTGPWFSGIARESFVTSTPNGESTQWLGHGLNHSRYTSPFYAVRSTPDRQVTITQVANLDNVRTVFVVVKGGPDPTGSQDSVGGRDFVPVSVLVNGGTGQTVFAEFGYLENGDPATGLYCTPRQDVCARGAQVAITGQANPYTFESGESTPIPTGVSCTSTCEVKIPAISGRTLYYRIKHVVSGSVTQTDAISMQPVR